MQHIVTTTPWHVTDAEVMDTDRYLSNANAPDFEEDVRLCIQSGARAMILNCAALTYMTGAGLRAFLNIVRMMSLVGGHVAVQSLRGQPREIFFACGMENMLPDNDEDVERPAVH